MTAVSDCVEVSSTQDEAHMVLETPLLPGSGEVVVEVPGKQIQKDCEGARMGSTVLGRYKNLVRRVSCVILMAMCSQILVRNAETLVPGQRAGVGQVRGRAAIALHLRPQISTATIAVPPVCEHLSRRQMSCGILVVIAGRQASRVLRWQAAIDGWHADAMGQSKGATGWPWKVSRVCVDIHFLLV